MLQVNDELCAGCSICVDTCLLGAIRLVEGRAEIDQELCTACEACLAACPNGAIYAVAETIQSVPIAAMPEVDAPIVPVSISAPLGETAAPARGLVPPVVAALAFISREIAPRVVDVLVNALERRLTKPVFNPPTTQAASPARAVRIGRGLRRQARHRSGLMNKQNFEKGGDDYARR